MRVPSIARSANTPPAFLYAGLAMVAAYACLSDPGAEMDPAGDVTQGAEPFTVARGPDGGLTVRPAGNPYLAADEDDDDDTFTCETVEECWHECLKLDANTCTCEESDDGQEYCCAPGEDVPVGGCNGGGVDDDGGGDDGRGTDDLELCGDLRDVLAEEYVRENVPGYWDCLRFYRPSPKWVVPLSQGIEWGLKHDHYGYADFRMTSKVWQMESRFNIVAHTTSGYRCPIGNSNVGGVDGSRHIEGRAYDFVVLGPRWTEELKEEIVDWVIVNGGYAYASEKGHVHVSW